MKTYICTVKQVRVWEDVEVQADSEEEAIRLAELQAMEESASCQEDWSTSVDSCEVDIEDEE